MKLEEKNEERNEDNDKLNKNIINEMIIIYKIEDKDKIKLFGENFIKNNKYNCNILIENKEKNIIENLNVNYNEKDRIIKIKLKEIKTITNMSYMFDGCKSLTSLPDISNWNTNNVKYMSNMFYNCKSLTSLPDISNWNINNVTNMSYIFYYCKSLTSLPDISKWNTNNVTFMNEMFSSCSLISIIILQLFLLFSTNFFSKYFYSIFIFYFIYNYHFIYCIYT